MKKAPTGAIAQAMEASEEAPEFTYMTEEQMNAMVAPGAAAMEATEELQFVTEDDAIQWETISGGTFYS